MWVSPNHPNPPRQPGPPPDEGQELATIKRKDGHELRVRLRTYESHPYILIQLWKLDADGAAWPVRGRSTSIRMTEIQDVVDALKTVVRDAPGEPGPGRQQDRAGPGKAYHDSSLPPAAVDAPVRGFAGGRGDEASYAPKGRPQRHDFREAGLPKMESKGQAFDEFEGAGGGKR